LITDAGFEKGHPIIMQSESGVVINILGPSSEAKDENILMDIGNKSYAGYTHIALRVSSIEDTEAHFNELGYVITERMSFEGISPTFIRDPDRNVIEFNEYEGQYPGTRAQSVL
jgi:lactoylglutathione lyase